MKNVIRKKEKANQIPRKINVIKEKSHTSPNVMKNVIREQKRKPHFPRCGDSAATNQQEMPVRRYVAVSSSTTMLFG